MFLRLLIVTLLLAAVGCSGGVATETPSADTGPPSVYAVNYPLCYFAEQVGGRHIEVAFPAPAGDPAFWSPDGDTIAAYQSADLILLNGADYAKWTRIVSLPENRLVQTSAKAKVAYIEVQDAVSHSHGPGEEHTHAGIAFTVWLDLDIAAVQIEAIRDALIEIAPDHEDDFRKQATSLTSRLQDLDARLAKLVEGRQDEPLLFSHPVYQYLIRRHQLNARSLHWEPDAEPSEKQWRELGELLEKHPAKWMIWEAEPLDSSVKRLDSLGVRSVVFEPCGNRPAEGDYLVAMERNLERLKPVFEQPAAQDSSGSP